LPKNSKVRLSSWSKIGLKGRREISFATLLKHPVKPKRSQDCQVAPVSVAVNSLLKSFPASLIGEIKVSPL
jgi:hypothetical protein